MKTTAIRTAFLLCLLVFPLPAGAFYNSHAGKWLSRDPIGEVGFQILRPKGKSQKKPDDGNLHHFVRNDPQNLIDPLGLVPPVPPWNPPRPRPLSQCELAILDATKMMGNVSNDARAHCISSCEIAKACGKWICRCLGNLKEARDLGAGGFEWVCSWVLPKSAEKWLNDHIQGGTTDDSAKDFEANEWGIDIGKEGGDCTRECERRYGTEP
ncbi:MAG TPA: hypothetical protein VNT99_21515 [Methylomirabilota bacterium]|nr:hypothetical protein [Methylomirabilota bacterium]